MDDSWPRIRIVRVITRMNVGGPAIHVIVLSKGLPPPRFSTSLVVGESDAREGDLSGLLPPDVKVIRVNTLRRSLRPWLDLCALLQLLHVLWKERPHILHTHMAKAGTLGRVAGLLYNWIGPGRRRGKRAYLIHTFHGHVLDGYFSAWLTEMFVSIERWLAARTDCLIAVSETVCRQLLAKGIGRRDQWRVIPLGLDLSELARLPFPNGQSRVRFGMIGRLVPIKNPRLFLDALHRTINRHPGRSVSGMIVGDGPLRKTLEHETRQLGLEGIVRFAGWQQDLPSVYEALEAACLTSWNEGTPVALIEAMAAGRPVIATDVGGVRDLLEAGSDSPAPIAQGAFLVAQQGILVRAGDAEGFSAALSALADDAGLRSRLGQAARAHVIQRYSQERLIADITALYEALERRRHP